MAGEYCVVGPLSNQWVRTITSTQPLSIQPVLLPYQTQTHTFPLTWLPDHFYPTQLRQENGDLVTLGNQHIKTFHILIQSISQTGSRGKKVRLKEYGLIKTSISCLAIQQAKVFLYSLFVEDAGKRIFTHLWWEIKCL